VAVRALKVLVVVMGVLIVGGTVTLVALLVQRAGGGGAGTAWQAALDQPEGARIAGIAASEGGIGIWVQRPDGDRVLVVDPKRGRVSGEIRLGR
jgi:Flp pilus assembly protein protease CpaA